MNKRRTAFMLCIALMTLMLNPASWAEEPLPVETVEVVEQEVTETPTVEEIIEATDEPTEAPSEEATAEPTDEPTIESTDEPTAEPTDEPIVETLTSNLTLQTRYAVAGEKAIEAQAAISGGMAPYAVRVCVILNDAIVHEENVVLSETGTISIRYLPESYGTHEVRVTVADSADTTKQDTASLPVAVIDRETRAEWEKTVNNVTKGDDWRKNIVAIAKSQSGYRESERDFIIGEDGKMQGYTRYGDWYGCTYEDWCAMFCAFVLEYADIPSYAVPRSAGSEKWKNELESRGAYESRGSYTPQAGDLIFFDREDENGKRDGKADHIGIVASVSGNTVTTIEGNVGNAVVQKQYDLSDKVILGYSNLGILMEEAGLDEVEIVEETIASNGVTNADQVNLRDRASKSGSVISVLETRGTAVTIQAKATRADGEVWYKVVAGDATGYVRADLINLAEIFEPADIKINPDREGVTLLTTAVDNECRWQRQREDGTWEDAGEGAMIRISPDADALLAWYRCVRTQNGAETAGEPIRPVRDELIEWLEEGEATSEMIIRALNTSTLEAITLEDDALIYVRTGEVIAHYDAETGIVTDDAMGIAVGQIIDGKLSPLPESATES